MVTMAADVARNGFNVTHDLGKYSAKPKNPVNDVYRHPKHDEIKSHLYFLFL